MSKLFSFSQYTQRHGFHLVDPSPWPLVGAVSALLTTFGGVMYFQSYSGGFTAMSLGMAFVLCTMYVWWRDVVREATFEGHHTHVVRMGMRMGMLLFIVSEVMFFFAFFWQNEKNYFNNNLLTSPWMYS
jgi:cytochrome c oxidase subunit 3